MSVTQKTYPVLLTTDLHLTANESDSYRWSIFDWLESLRERHDARTLIICGDLTDAKDNHSSILVNRVVESLVAFTRHGVQVIVVQGNHDYLLKGHPFFAFFNSVQGLRFITDPVAIGPWVFLPHSRTLPLPGLELVDDTITHCFLHQTVNGAIASNGQRMEGELRGRMARSRTCKYYSGDIHVPQRVADVEYVGSPYPVHFGDSFKPQVLALLNEDGVERHEWQGLQRVTAKVSVAKDLQEYRLQKGDQLKVRLSLSRQDLPEWQERKRDVQQWCDRRGVQLVSVELMQPAIRRQLRDEDGVSRAVDVSPDAVLRRYAKDRGVDPDVLDIGLGLLNKEGEGQR